ncbi:MULTISPECIES: 5-oxoprolinase subunit PxpA [Halomonas]|uniref:5-oxoprolinase subunit PxpA n=1 Tax=Halomonas TaxID=2745 RepID=UPI001C9609D3|nr:MULTISPECIES: 5-oxoprolinase subunit PxpA [Halomonas]MBY6207960.1 5-oxoprolinase subunit PxpA [Halomonas sp. DP3Y7-2]MBY6228769.1 5-oxoprolinase subunit PxpA [Halomonas sp. DP3Y7-1]MCA0917247.1 5-oxoprolinase subunit PxpA [Halomonas denitrificans]
MTTLDLNADMGEGFGAWRIGGDIDDRIMASISSANIATGFHAGDPSTMTHSLRQAAQFGVAVGAHPGFRDLVGFGRRHIHASPEELVNDVIYQLGALRELAAREGLGLHHLKLHGALYMHAAKDESFATALCQALTLIDAHLPIYCLAGSMIDRVAEDEGIPRVHEFYADRDYDDEGSIIFVRQVQQLDPEAVAEKVLLAAREGVVKTTSGRQVPVSFQSVCLHSDSPGALALLDAIRRRLSAADIALKAP